MKARIKKTGEIVNIAEYAKIALDRCDSFGNPIEMKPEEVELIDDETVELELYKQLGYECPLQDYWQDVRERAAIAAMQGVMNFFCSIDYNRDTIAELAVEQADALIEELKKK